MVEGSCPNLLREADQYRYSDKAEDGNSENPVCHHNHALEALRYLIISLNDGVLARTWRTAFPSDGNDSPLALPPSIPPPPPPAKKTNLWQHLHEHQGWTYLT